MFLYSFRLKINIMRRLYSCADLIPSNVDITMKPIDSYPSKYVLPTMYKTQPGGIVNENAPQVGVGSTTSDDMLTLAIRIQGEENRLKVIHTV